MHLHAYTELHQTMSRVCEHHDMALLLQDSLKEVHHTQYGQILEDQRYLFSL